MEENNLKILLIDFSNIHRINNYSKNKLLRIMNKIKYNKTFSKNKFNNDSFNKSLIYLSQLRNEIKSNYFSSRLFSFCYDNLI